MRLSPISNANAIDLHALPWSLQESMSKTYEKSGGCRGAAKNQTSFLSAYPQIYLGYQKKLIDTGAKNRSYYRG
jgi:hypothetical protein